MLHYAVLHCHVQVLHTLQEIVQKCTYQIADLASKIEKFY